jgi:hypothetical protein
MILADFEVEVTRNEEKHSCQVIVYDTADALNQAARDYGKTHELEALENDVRAITHNFQHLVISPDGSERTEGRTSIVRIDKSAGATVVSHELLHAACQMYRIWHGDINLGDECGEAEENLAHIHSDLVYNTCNKLIALGVWA